MSQEHSLIIVDEQPSPFRLFIEHQRRACKSAQAALKALIPTDFKAHGKQALKETKAAWRALYKGLKAELPAPLRSTPKPSAPDSSSTGQHKTKINLN